MDTSLDSLDPRFKPYAFALLARLTEARIPVIIVNTRRTEAEQKIAIAQGVSWTSHSKHQDGLAIDVVPYATYILHGMNKAQWSAKDPIWLTIGQLGESIHPSLQWGGRWPPINEMGIGKDPGHFEYAGSNAPGGVPV